MKSHHNHKETFCLYHCLVLTALMPLGVKKASHHSQTLRGCKRPLWDCQLGSKVENAGLAFGSTWLGGKLKPSRQEEEKFHFLMYLSSGRGCATLTVPLITPCIFISYISHAHRDRHVHTHATQRFLWLQLAELLVGQICIAGEANLHPKLNFNLCPHGSQQSARILVELWDICYQ